MTTHDPDTGRRIREDGPPAEIATTITTGDPVAHLAAYLRGVEAALTPGATITINATGDDACTLTASGTARTQRPMR